MQNDFAAALKHFRAAVQINPKDANAQADLGAALEATGDLKEARVHLEKALAIDPKLPNARENLEQLNRKPPDNQ